MADTTELNQMVAKLVLKKAELAAIKQKEKEANKELTEIKLAFLVKLKELGQRSYECPEGSASIKTVYSVKVPKTAEEKKELFDYLLSKGEDTYYHYLGVHSRSLNSLFKKELDEAKRKGEGMEFKLPGVGAPTPFETLSIGEEGNEYDASNE